MLNLATSMAMPTQQSPSLPYQATRDSCSSRMLAADVKLSHQYGNAYTAVPLPSYQVTWDSCSSRMLATDVKLSHQYGNAYTAVPLPSYQAMWDICSSRMLAVPLPSYQSHGMLNLATSMAMPTQQSPSLPTRSHGIAVAVGC